MADNSTLIFGILGLLVTASANTAIFIWRLVSVRDSIVSQMQLMKTAIDLEIDMIRKEITEHRVKIAEEYLRKDSFHLSMNKMEATTAAGLAKVEASLEKLDQKLERLTPRSVG